MKKRREVFVGKIGIGGNNPVRVQSMTNTDTADVEKTLDQIRALQKAGCELVRLAVASPKHVKALEKIKLSLQREKCEVSLVADIHFQPALAMAALDFADKVRINPGNFASGGNRDELPEVEEKLLPLLEKCKRLKRALRIGVNHGSLSKRILEEYGDTPRGMVKSALEYVEICRKANFHDLILSLKASNPSFMISANELLALEMEKLGWDYPLHLGVTEAGEGEDGRVKSAIGIGTLLLQGIGDTIRVSLTEDPVREIGPCKVLKALYRDFSLLEKKKGRLPQVHLGVRSAPFDNKEVDFFVFKEELCFKEKKLVLLSLNTAASFKGEFALGINAQEEIGGLKPKAVILTASSYDEVLHFFRKNDVKYPLFFRFRGLDPISFSAVAGALISKGYGDGIILEKEELELGLNILQTLGQRRYKAEFISCPGCGRTLFDLQARAREIKTEFRHLKGVKIAVMGCIVNGPGEMADSDFGYVGSGKGRIDLYFKKECVEKNIPESQAKEKLAELIKFKGYWKEC